MEARVIEDPDPHFDSMHGGQSPPSLGNDATTCQRSPPQLCDLGKVPDLLGPPFPLYKAELVRILTSEGAMPHSCGGLRKQLVSIMPAHFIVL